MGFGVAAPLIFASSLGCISEWIEWQRGAEGIGSPFEEHVLRDTRVLGVRVSPTSVLRYPLSLVNPSWSDTAFRPLDLEVEVFAIDPRGGRFDVELALCPLGGQQEDVGDLASKLADCWADAGPLPQFRRTVVADLGSFGELPDLRFPVSLDETAFRYLLAGISSEEPDLTQRSLAVALRVTPLDASSPLPVWAHLNLPLLPDLGDAADHPWVSQWLEEQYRTRVCPTAGDWNPADLCIDHLASRVDVAPPFPGMCGDGVRDTAGLEREECDVPEAEWCSDDCRLLAPVTTLCARGPSCIYDIPPTPSPTLLGLSAEVSEERSTANPAVAFVADADALEGETLVLPPRPTAVYVAATPDSFPAFWTARPATTKYEGSDHGWVQTDAQLEWTTDLPRVAVYVLADGPELLPLAEGDGDSADGWINARGRPKFLVGPLPEGRSFPIWVAFGNGRGGMDVRRFALRAE